MDARSSRAPGNTASLVGAIDKFCLATAGTTLLPGALEAQETATAWDACRIANDGRAVPMSTLTGILYNPGCAKFQSPGAGQHMLSARRLAKVLFSARPDDEDPIYGVTY
jgi:hypothetical protein